MTRALDGTSDQMRKDRNKQSIVDEAARRGDIAAIDIDHISDFLKGVERNARRQKNLDPVPRDRMHAERGENLDKGIDKKVEILEKSQKRKINDEGKQQQIFAAAVVGRGRQPVGNVVVEASRAAHQEQEPVIPPAVKEITAREQQPILPAKPKLPINGDYQAQKNKIDRGVEKHRSKKRNQPK